MAIPSLATYGGTLLQPGYPGQVSEGGLNVIRSMINANATGVDFGVAVGRVAGTAFGQTDKCCAIVTGSEIVQGISVRNPAPLVAPAAGGNNSVLYAQNTPVPVMTFGVITVLAGETVAEGDTVLFITASQQFGSVQTGALAGTTRIAVPTAIWLDPATVGNTARIRITASAT
jgi:hypothetical protein